MTFVFGEFEADERLCRLLRGGERVHVEPRAFDLLLYLIRHRDRVVPKAELLESVWRGVAVSASSLSTCMNSLRGVLGVPSGALDPIETVRARGYRFVAPVEERPYRSAASRGLAPRDEPFVGRADVLGVLERRLAEARAGRTSVVVLAGEAGIGKTRTAEQLAALAREADVAVLASRCPEDAGRPPFWLWIAILRQLTEALGGPALRELLGPAVFEIAALLPELDAGPDGGAHGYGAPNRYRLFDAVARLLAHRARSAPILVTIEDLQWADPASLHLLEHAAAELRESAVLFLCTLRQGPEPAAGHVARTLAELARLAHFERIEIGPLSESELAGYVAAVCGEAPTEAIVRALRERTDGNPLFAREWVRILVREGGALADVTQAAIPPTLRDVIARRLADLGPRTLELVRHAAVIGRDFDLRLLAEVTDAAPEELLEAIDEAIAGGVLRELPGAPGRLRFSHALVRDALYEGLAPGDRARVHERVAGALEAQSEARPDERLSELAHHWRRAAPLRGAERSVEYAVRAAARALSQTAYEEAALQLERALASSAASPEGDERRLELLLGVGGAWLEAGDAQRTRERYAEAAELARALGRPADFVKAALGYGGSAIWGNAPDARARALLEEANERLGAGPAALRAQLGARLATLRSYSGDLAAQREPARAALACARASGEAEPLAEALHALHFVLRGPDHLDERAELAQELLALDVRDEYTFAIRESLAADRLARLDRAGFAEMLERAERLRDASHHPALRWLATANVASAALLEGRLADAERGMVEATELARRARNPQALPLAIGQTLALRRERGTLAEVEGPFEAIAERLDWIGSYPTAMLAVLRAELGRTEPAREAFVRALDAVVATGARREDWLISTTELAKVAAALGERDRAVELYDALLPYSGRFAVLPGALLSAGPVDRALGLLAAALDRRTEAAAHLEAALGACGAVHAHTARVRTLADLGGLLAAAQSAGERERGRTLRGEAEDGARRLGIVL
jgi:DNA-binding winged helix-turn-helix (wHTH) protein/tetratricopeptide (TPR) repeat protein